MDRKLRFREKPTQNKALSLTNRANSQALAELIEGNKSLCKKKKKKSMDNDYT